MNCININESIVDEFIDNLDNELSIRKKDLSSLKEIIDSTNNLNNKFTLMRSTYPSLYAHYEGFLKSSFWYLIDSIKNTNTSLIDLNPNFIILSLVPSLEAHLVKQVSKSNAMVSVFDKVFNGNINLFDAMLKDKYVINHDTLQSTFDLLGINYNNINCSGFDNKNFPLTELGILYERRNGLAHGEVSPNTFKVFSLSKSSDINKNQVDTAYTFWMDGYDNVISSLELLKNIFLDYLIEEKYLGNLSPIAF
ncbi:MAE_28990/MAE_18760 family HEPN-like nuclease [Terrisporobacter petrolearius]|uniref:MAE_28990/MAE_18760 family HEPN-like nuclease n=1 Tax=Terrisporobacter petrolearius TaxID=1460447 RepID=UPI003AFF7D46